MDEPGGPLMQWIERSRRPAKLTRTLDEHAPQWAALDRQWGAWLQGRDERRGCPRAVTLTRAMGAGDLTAITSMLREFAAERPERSEGARRTPMRPAPGRSAWSEADLAQLRRDYSCGRFNGRSTGRGV